MAKTTAAGTIGLMSLRQYLAKIPKTVIIRPPTIKAPNIAPGLPIATKALTNVKDVPTTTGKREPINNWIIVPIPAIKMAPRIACAVSSGSPKTPKTIITGVILATNIDKTCCKPNGIAFKSGTRPFTL